MSIKYVYTWFYMYIRGVKQIHGDVITEFPFNRMRDTLRERRYKTRPSLFSKSIVLYYKQVVNCPHFKVTLSECLQSIYTILLIFSLGLCVLSQYIMTLWHLLFVFASWCRVTVLVVAGNEKINLNIIG